MNIAVVQKEKQLISLSKEDFIIKELLLEKTTTIMNLVTLKIRYGVMDEMPDLSDYDVFLKADRNTPNLSELDFIEMLKEKQDTSYLSIMLESILTYYLNNLLKYVAGLNMSIDSIFEDYPDLVQYGESQKAKGDDRVNKILYIFNNMMFALFFHNKKYKDGLKEQTKENIIKEEYIDDETGKPFYKYLVPYCLALRTTICGMLGEFKIRSEVNRIREEYGFKPYTVPFGSMLHKYFETLYDKSAEFHDNKMMEIVYMDESAEFGSKKFTLYRTLEKGYRIVFG